MNPVQRLYEIAHRFLTPAAGRGSHVSPGYWNHLVRRTVLEAVHGVRGAILDVGCGDGLFLAELARQNPQARIWAVDIDQASIALAQERLSHEAVAAVHFSQQDATMLDFDPGMFDLVICTNVFMTMDSPDSVRKALQSLSRVAKKEALLFFDYRNAANPLVRLKYRLAPWYDRTLARRHVRADYPRHIEAVLDEARMHHVQRWSLGLPWLKSWAPVIVIKARKL